MPAQALTLRRRGRVEATVLLLVAVDPGTIVPEGALLTPVPIGVVQVVDVDVVPLSTCVTVVSGIVSVSVMVVHGVVVVPRPSVIVAIGLVMTCVMVVQGAVVGAGAVPTGLVLVMGTVPGEVPGAVPLPYGLVDAGPLELVKIKLLLRPWLLLDCVTTTGGAVRVDSGDEDINEAEGLPVVTGTADTDELVGVLGLEALSMEPETSVEPGTGTQPGPQAVTVTTWVTVWAIGQPPGKPPKADAPVETAGSDVLEVWVTVGAILVLGGTVVVTV